MSVSVRAVEDHDRVRGRNDIAAAAVAIVLGGDEPVTMRSVGGRLGVQASTLYQYVRDKDELLALVVDQVLGAVPTGSGALPERATALTEHLVRIVNATPGVVRVFRVAPDTTHRAITALLQDPAPDPARPDEVRTALAAAITGLLVWGATPGGPAEAADDPVALCSLLRAAVTALLDGYGRSGPEPRPARATAPGAVRGVSGSIAPPRTIRFEPAPGAR